VLLTAFDPTVGDDRIVLRMSRIHEVDRVFLTLVLLKLFVLLEEGGLGLGIGLARQWC
jgi:hypothetical protein